MKIEVTTPYCSGLSLLQTQFVVCTLVPKSNHPLLFGTVSPTRVYVSISNGSGLGNHPLLFGTVSPTRFTGPVGRAGPCG